MSRDENMPAPVRMRAGIHAKEQDRYERDRKRYGKRIADQRRHRRMAGDTREAHGQFHKQVRAAFDAWAKGRPESDTGTCDWLLCV